MHPQPHSQTVDKIIMSLITLATPLVAAQKYAKHLTNWNL